MKPINIADRTRAIDAPRDWDQNLDGRCDVLPVRDRIELQSGINFMESLWQPNEAELALLQQGLPVLLRVSGHMHPVVSVSVASPDDVS